MSFDVLFIGHCTRDEITINGSTEYRAGGGVYFGATACGWCLKHFSKGGDHKLKVLTIGKPSDYDQLVKEINASGIDISIIESEHTTTFAHSFRDNDPDQRISTVPAVAKSFSIEDFKNYHAKVFYVNPLLYGEVDPSLFKLMKKQCDLLSLDAQGIIRRLENGNLVKRPPEDLKATLEGVDFLKVDIDEAAILTGLDKGDTITASRQLQALGPRYVLCTESKGAAFYDGEKRYFANFGEWKLEGRTGRGDTITSSFILLRFVLGYETQVALNIAAQACSHKMMHPGAAVEADFENIKI